MRAKKLTMNGHFQNRLYTHETALVQVNAWKANKDRIVFTNGCFDILHPGHIHLLNKARNFGQRLVVGLNTDISVKQLKGPTRPIFKEQDRAAILGSIRCVDIVLLFDGDTPENLINFLKPDILVKGADYKFDQVVGKEIVESYGGKVHLVELLKGYSTTKIVRKLLKSCQTKLAKKY